MSPGFIGAKHLRNIADVTSIASSARYGKAKDLIQMRR
jgi:hypothetical protein